MNIEHHWTWFRCYWNWLTSPCWETQSWSSGNWTPPFFLTIEYSCAMLHTREMDALWFMLRSSHFGRLGGHCLGQFPWSTRYTIERKTRWPNVIKKKTDDVYHRSMSQKPSYESPPWSHMQARSKWMGGLLDCSSSRTWTVTLGLIIQNKSHDYIYIHMILPRPLPMFD